MSAISITSHNGVIDMVTAGRSIGVLSRKLVLDVALKTASSPKLPSRETNTAVYKNTRRKLITERRGLVDANGSTKRHPTGSARATAHTLNGAENLAASTLSVQGGQVVRTKRQPWT